MSLISTYGKAFFGNTTLHGVDVGTGVGISLLAGAAVNPDMKWVGIEVDPNRIRLAAAMYKTFAKGWKKTSNRSLHVGYLRGDCTEPLNLRGAQVILLWDWALIVEVVKATLKSLARSYTQPFLLVMSSYWWYDRSLPEIEDVFEMVQVVGCSAQYKFRASKGGGDSLIIAIVGSPKATTLDASPTLDANSVSVVDVLNHRFDSDSKRLAEFDRLLNQCDEEIKRISRKPNKWTYSAPGMPDMESY